MTGPLREFDLDNEEEDKFLSELDLDTATAGSNNVQKAGSVTTAKKFTKRSFPGPAGLLPNLEPSEFSLLDKRVKSNKISKRLAQILPVKEPPVKRRQSSQSSQDDKILLEGRCWYELRKSLQLVDRDDKSPLETMDIAWIEKKTRISSSTFHIKIPFLAAALQKSPEVVRTLTGVARPPTVKLLDASGSISAGLDTAFVVKYGSELNPGTCLALQNFGIILVKRELILVLTINNVIFITSESKPLESNEEEEYNVKTTTVSEFNPEKIIEHYNMFDTLVAIAAKEDRGDDDDGELKVKSRGLFANAEAGSATFTSDTTPKEDSSHDSAVSVQEDMFDDGEDEFLKNLGEELLS